MRHVVREIEEFIRISGQNWEKVALIPDELYDLAKEIIRERNKAIGLEHSEGRKIILRRRTILVSMSEAKSAINEATAMKKAMAPFVKGA